MSSKLRQEIFYYFEKKIFNSFSECNVVDYLKKLTTFEDGVQVKYTIVIDAESCLDRLYGGYFSDWQSGGDWKRLHTFYNELKSTCVRHCIDMVIFFDGASVDASEKFAWLQRQFDDRCKINHIFHGSEQVDVSSGATSLPSTAATGATTTNRKFCNWISPVFLRQMITHETQYDNDGHVKDHLAEQRDERPIKIYFSLNDYRKELLRFCSDNVHNLLFTNDLELVVMHAVNNQDDQDTSSNNQQRARLDLQYTELFWAKSFLLSQRNQIMNGKRIMYDNICSCLDLDTEQFAFLSILIGTRWFPPEWLFNFYRSITPMIRDQVDIDVCLIRMSKTVIDNIIEFIRENGRPVDLNRLSSVLFGRDSGDDFLAKMSALRLNIDYLFNRSFDSIDLSFHRQYLPATKTLKKYLNDLSGNVNAPSMGYQKHQKHHNYHHQKGQQQQQQEFSQSHEPSYAKKWIDMHFCKNEKQSHLVERQLALLNINDDPILTFDSILKIVHTSGIRSHWIYNLLKYRELFLSVSLEPILEDQKMRIDHVYRNLRMRCYSILFAGECKQQEAELAVSASMSASLVNVNQSEMSTERCQSFVDQHQSVLYADDDLVTVREYSYDTKENRVETTDINFRPQYHQSLDKLWSLTRRARLKLFIECINGNQRTEELNDMFDSNRKVNYYLIPCFVLRYIISTGLFITYQDVHVFLMTFEMSFRIKDTNDKDINRKDDKKQDPDMRYKRAIHLASIFTRGIETVAFANDTCGHPFNSNYFELRNFFEGQLFQANYAKIYFNQALSSKLYWESTKLDLKLRNILVELATHGVERCLLGSEGPNEAIYENRAFPVRLQRNFLNELFCINSDVSKVESTTATKAITKSTIKTSQSTLNNHKTVYKSKSHSKNSKSFPNKKPADESRQLVQPKRGGFGRGLLVMDNRRDNSKAKRSGYSSREDSDDGCNERRRNTGMLDSSWVTVNKNRDRSPDRPKSKAQLEDEAQVSQCLEKIKVIRHNRKVKKIQQMREKAKEAGEPFPDDYDYNTDDSYENALYPYPIEHQLLHDEVNDLSDYERFVPESPFSIRYKFNPEIERLLEKESGKKITPKQPRDKRTPKTYPQFVKAQDMPIFPFSMDDLREMKQHYLERIEMEKKKKEEYEKSVAHLIALKESVNK